MSAPRAESLSPISGDDWSYARAAHLLERAGFGGTPGEIEHLANLSPGEAVAELVDYRRISATALPEFEDRPFDERPDLTPYLSHLAGTP